MCGFFLSLPLCALSECWQAGRCCEQLDERKKNSKSGTISATILAVNVIYFGWFCCISSEFFVFCIQPFCLLVTE